MSEARIHPPSEQRLSDARRSGHVPRAPLVGLFAVWASLSFGLSLAAPSLLEACEKLLRTPLEAAAGGRTFSLRELWQLAGGTLLNSMAWVLLAAFMALALGTFITQGPAFGPQSFVQPASRHSCFVSACP
jgi:type III secretory pathway component EscU